MRSLRLLSIITVSLLLGLNAKVTAQPWLSNATGTYYDYGVKSVAIGTTPSTFYKLFVTSNDVNDRRYTLGLTNTFASTTFKRGIYNYTRGGTSSQEGIYNNVTGNTSTGYQRGMYNYVNGGTAQNWGLYNYVYNRGTQGIGTQNYVYDYQTSGTIYGSLSDIYMNATTGGTKYGVYSRVRGAATNTGTNYGVYTINQNPGAGTKFGMYSTITSTGAGTKYGVYSLINSTAAGSKYGMYSNIGSTGTGTKVGVYSVISSAANGVKYGLLASVNTGGTGTKFGVYSIAPGATNWAGYFYGRGYFRESVGIGTTVPGVYKLAVKGRVGIDGLLQADAIQVINVNLPDYVFAKDYNLRSLDEVEEFINKNSHLPEVPSAKEVAKNGMNITEMNNALLKKVEELTLYMIAQQKEINELKAKTSELNSSK